MVARAILERSKCHQCGGDLRETLTDNPPYEDHYNFGHKISESWCRDCVAIEKYRRLQAKHDESVDNSPADAFPEARRISVTHIPLPDAERGPDG